MHAAEMKWPWHRKEGEGGRGGGEAKQIREDDAPPRQRHRSRPRR